MKKLLIIFAAASIVLFFNSCNQECGKNVDRAKELIEVENVLEEYILANENQDFDLIQKIWAPKSDIILYGTDSDEKLIGWTNIRNAIKNQFNQIHDTYISSSDLIIQMNDCANTAWFAETLNYNFIYKDQAHSYVGMRFTGVLQKIDGQWRFVQAHLSLPAHVNIEK